MVNFICILCMCTCLVMFNSLQPPRTAASQALLSMEFSRQKYQRGLRFLSPGDLLYKERGTEPESCSSCIGRQILYHWVTWELCTLYHSLKKKINSYSAKDDYRLSQENTETMVRNSGHVKHYGIWYSLKKKKKPFKIRKKTLTVRILFYKISVFAKFL